MPHSRLFWWPIAGLVSLFLWAVIYLAASVLFDAMT